MRQSSQCLASVGTVMTKQESLTLLSPDTLPLSPPAFYVIILFNTEFTLLQRHLMFCCLAFGNRGQQPTLHHHLESYRKSTKSINNLSRLDIFITVSPINEYGILLKTFFLTHIYLQICIVASIKILYIFVRLLR